MKSLLTIIIALLMLNTYAQIGGSYGIGLSNFKAIGGIQITYDDGLLHTSLHGMVHITSNSTDPQLLIASVGVNLGQFQPFISGSLQSIGGVAETYYKHTPDRFINGAYGGGGINYNFKNIEWLITAQQQGKFSMLTIYKKI